MKAKERFKVPNKYFCKFCGLERFCMISKTAHQCGSGCRIKQVTYPYVHIKFIISVTHTAKRHIRNLCKSFIKVTFKAIYGYGETSTNTHHHSHLNVTQQQTRRQRCRWRRVSISIRINFTAIAGGYCVTTRKEIENFSSLHSIKNIRSRQSRWKI